MARSEDGWSVLTGAAAAATVRTPSASLAVQDSRLEYILVIAVLVTEDTSTQRVSPWR
jgi:hypothetical protein